MFLILSVIFAFANLLAHNFEVFYLWIMGLAIFVAGFGLALARSHTDKRIYRSLINIPKFMFLQVLSLLKLFTPQTNNVATQHYVETHIDDINHKNEN